MSLFDGLESRSHSKPKQARAIARGACSLCSANSVALVRSPNGKHLVWRMHDFVTFAGTRVPCQASAQHLCDVPARRVEGVATPTCLHSSVTP